ncbi:MAG TPA: Rnf-Nqr domain containing protein [Desulfomonilaceae bacterium]|nr:Rnf-Nqr domain containing protein [Desulfomonilaceae bacterium]
MKISRFLITTSFCLVLLLLGLAPVMAEGVGSGSFQKDTGIEISFGLPVDEAWAKNPANFDVYEKSDPDIKIAVDSVTLDPRRISATLRFKEPLNLAAEYVVDAKDITSDGKVIGARQFTIKKSETQVLFGLLLGAMLISNFVFTKYLGLCIFFGVSQKKDTAIGMGITFTTVMILSAVMCWALLTFVLLPYNLSFLRIIVFIGTVAIFVQAVDTILRKVNPYLFKRLGVYLVLITTNCIILAVPLENADGGHGPFASFTYALGAGVGFAIALFLMACVREKLEVCRVPPSFQGLPIAFIVAGLFALAFLGFSGLAIF